MKGARAAINALSSNGAVRHAGSAQHKLKRRGIFFTSKVLDAFDISPGGVFFASVSPMKNTKDTAIWMKLGNASDRSRKEVYDAYASPENNYAFDRTVVPVKMAEHSENDLISRSQAKRLLVRIDRFRTAVLDFKNVHQSANH